MNARRESGHANRSDFGSIVLGPRAPLRIEYKIRDYWRRRAITTIPHPSPGRAWIESAVWIRETLQLGSWCSWETNHFCLSPAFDSRDASFTLVEIVRVEQHFPRGPRKGRLSQKFRQIIDEIVALLGCDSCQLCLASKLQKDVVAANGKRRIGQETFLFNPGKGGGVEII